MVETTFHKTIISKSYRFFKYFLSLFLLLINCSNRGNSTGLINVIYNEIVVDYFSSFSEIIAVTFIRMTSASDMSIAICVPIMASKRAGTEYET